MAALLQKNTDVFTRPRLTTLAVSTIVGLCSGTNYVYSAYAPQLGARLGLSHTQLNLIALGGNIGMYASGPFSGRIVDTRGPKPLFIYAFVCLLVGYVGIWGIFSSNAPSESTSDEREGGNGGIVALLMFLSFLTGTGGNAGFCSAVNATAKTFPDHARATATGIVISGFGLSAFFFSTLAHYAFPGDTDDFLALLAIGTAGPMVLGYLFVKPIPLEDHASSEHFDEEEGETLLNSRTNLLPTDDIPPALSNSTPEPYGLQLLAHLDFWLLFSMMALLTGIGLMYINNAGSIAQSLAYPSPSGAYQATQVSAISLANFLSRILIGLAADQAKRFVQQRGSVMPRSFVIPIIACGFLVSQCVLLGTREVGRLWIASVCTGGSYGTVYVIFPNVAIEWFGITHFSENWGFVSLAPIVGGNVFSLAFGRDVDRHSTSTTTTIVTSTTSNSTAAAAAITTTTMVPRTKAPAIECTLGAACYVDTIRLTTCAAALALVLSGWACARDWRRSRR